MSSHRAARTESGPGPGDQVAAVVAAARARVRLVVLIASATVFVPAGVAAGAALALAGVAPVWIPFALGVAGAAAAASWAAWCTPTIAAVARRLDAALGLRDRVAAALQFRGSEAPVAALVHRDAAARLAGVQLTAVFPMTTARLAPALIALACGLSAWLAWTGTPVTAPQRATAAPDARGAGTAGATAGRRVAARGNPPAAAETVQAPSASSAPRADPNQPSAAEASGAATRQGVAPRPAGEALAPGRQTIATPAVSRLADRAGGDAAPAAATSTALGSPAQSVPARDVQGGGGVSRGGALAAADRHEPSPVLSADRFATAQAKAEAALARDVVPPAYRDDVRAYFRALAAGGSR